MVLALMFKPDVAQTGMGTLCIAVKQAQNLPHLGTDAFAKCYLLPDKSAKGKRKTNVVKNNLNPVWEERFTYEKVTLEELSKERVLEVTLWDFNKGSSNDFVGGIRLGSAPGGTTSKHKEWMDSIGEEVSHWEAMLTHPGEWVEQRHILRHTMDPIKDPHPSSLSLSVPVAGGVEAKDSMHLAVQVELEGSEVRDTSVEVPSSDAKAPKREASQNGGDTTKVPTLSPKHPVVHSGVQLYGHNGANRIRGDLIVL